MFIYSAKMDKKKLLTLLACGGVAALVLVLVFCRGCGRERSASVSALPQAEAAAARSSSEKLLKRARIRAPEDVTGLMTELGWTVEPVPVETVEVVIPEVFSEVYSKYNELQLSQGLDLSKYAGKTATRWTVRVTGHPSGEEEVYATLLVINSRVVGGDVCSARLGGFMHGLSPESYEGGAPTFAEELPEAEDVPVPEK